MFCRLFSRALTHRAASYRLTGAVRRSGTSTNLRPERYAPVTLRGALQMSCARCRRRRSRRRARRHRGRHPQYSPPARMVSSSCSTTIRVLPRSRRRFMRGNQLIVVALVQADAGLIQHIQHAGQCAADLGRQADALALAAGKGRCAARQGQVPQTHALQKAQTLFDLFEDGGSDDFIPLGHFCRAE